MGFLYGVGVVLVLVVFFVIKDVVWDKPHDEIYTLKSDIEKIQEIHLKEISCLKERLKNSESLHIQENDFEDIVLAYAWKEINELCNKEFAFLGVAKYYYPDYKEKELVVETIKERFRNAINAQYRYKYLIYLYPELEKIFCGDNVTNAFSEKLTDIEHKNKNLFEVVNILKSNSKMTEELIYLKNRVEFLESTKSNLTAIPYMAGIMADYETYGLEHLAKALNWGYAQKRMDKVKAIREIRRDAQAIVEKNKEAQYQLAYLFKLFPTLEELVDLEFNQLPIIKVSELSQYDSVRDYLSKEEYSKLSTIERNQLALDRYKHSHKRSKWQIGRDYELYVGYEYSRKGYDVDYFGSYMGLEDLGRDLIAKKDDDVLIIQCKYWSSKKQIHENHIAQLYGTMISYCIENKIDKSKVKGLLVTNITLTPIAEKMAKHLGIKYVQQYEAKDYPCIKCNIGHDEDGRKTKIYHLPFDQQYDSTKINGKGEFMAMTVAEAEESGFRRAYRWYGAE